MAKAKKSKKVTLKNNTLLIAKVVGVILLIPLLGNIFADGWQWSILDFVTMGALLFGTGMAIDYVIRTVTNPVHRAIGILAILAALLVIWIQLAVDGVSQLFTFFS